MQIDSYQIELMLILALIPGLLAVKLGKELYQ